MVNYKIEVAEENNNFGAMMKDHYTQWSVNYVCYDRLSIRLVGPWYHQHKSRPQKDIGRPLSLSHSLGHLSFSLHLTCYLSL